MWCVWCNRCLFRNHRFPLCPVRSLVAICFLAAPFLCQHMQCLRCCPRTVYSARKKDSLTKYTLIRFSINRKADRSYLIWTTSEFSFLHSVVMSIITTITKNLTMNHSLIRSSDCSYFYPAVFSHYCLKYTLTVENEYRLWLYKMTMWTLALQFLCRSSQTWRILRPRFLPVLLFCLGLKTQNNTDTISYKTIIIIFKKNLPKICGTKPEFNHEYWSLASPRDNGFCLGLKVF